ncbi:hypothetical protein NDU88_007283 [Pleurodeles waltl]|uniref:Uncharacterized protein n=1 Tax=Pleurodeles waltl TaxID=8319 RepID=A0AAV7NSS6_PLEWA|nr:hypothetical protein NDU88_007283 [Pleurodeles waltl]
MPPEAGRPDGVVTGPRNCLRPAAPPCDSPPPIYLYLLSGGGRRRTRQYGGRDPLCHSPGRAQRAQGFLIYQVHQPGPAQQKQRLFYSGIHLQHASKALRKSRPQMLFLFGRPLHVEHFTKNNSLKREHVMKWEARLRHSTGAQLPQYL